jgi:hypothetical protein
MYPIRTPGYAQLADWDDEIPMANAMGATGLEPVTSSLSILRGFTPARA